jgi:putative redox protein
LAGGGGDLRRQETPVTHRREDGALTDPTPPLTAELIWDSGTRFAAVSGASAIVVDGDGVAGPSPMQVVAFGLAGCMAADVATILEKGRHPLKGLRLVLRGTRAETPPRRFTAFMLTFHVTGDVPASAVERAIALSRETYCSVWHSLRQDIPFATNYDIAP